MFEIISAIVVLSVFICAMLSIVWSTIQTGISPMPSNIVAIHTAMTLLPDEHSGTLYDLGSGWGNAAAHFARHHPTLQVIGIEQSWLPYLFSRWWYRQSNLQFQRGDFFNITPKPHSILYCYLYTGGMLQVSTHREFKSCWIVSNTFACPYRTPMYESIVQDVHHSRIYVYPPDSASS